MRPVLAQKSVRRTVQSRIFAHVLSIFGVTALLVLAQPAAAHELAEMAAGFGGFIINGIGIGDRSGISVSGAGDVNGDGLDDVIIGAFQASPESAREGAAYVVFGTAATDPIELSDIESGFGGFAILGINTDDWTGFNVSGGGDVNGDGRDDVIVGSYFGNKSYVVFGKQTTGAVDAQEILNGTGGFAIVGDHGAAFGAVSAAGDVNGDLRDDLVVGAGFFGDAFVIYGKASTGSVDLFDLYDGLGGFAILASGAIGGAVSGAGDVNGDGFDDVIVGHHGEAVGAQLRAGRTYVVFGKADSAPVSLIQIADDELDDPALGFVINGINALDEAGFSVSRAGDVNGDLLADVVIGAPYQYPSDVEGGEAYVVFGKADTAPVSLLDVFGGVGGFAMLSNAAQDFTGFSVSDAGDVNGDFLDDVIVGAFGADANYRSRVGTSYVVFGKADTATVDLSQVAEGVGGVPLIGTNEDDQSGISVSGAGDVNGDGFFDVVIGADSADPDAKSQAGVAYVVFGGLRPPSTWVDFAHGGIELGTFSLPFNTLGEALDVVLPGRSITIKGDSDIVESDEIMTINQSVTITAVGGPVFIGVPEP